MTIFITAIIGFSFMLNLNTISGGEETDIIPREQTTLTAAQQIESLYSNSQEQTTLSAEQPIESLYSNPNAKSWISFFLILPCFFLFLRLGLLYEKKRTTISDSKEFNDAMEQWFPLVYANNKTPRSIKRFINRVRYYAMIQRKTDELSTDNTTYGGIPDHILVAYSVIHDCCPDLIFTNTDPQNDTNGSQDTILSRIKNIMKDENVLEHFTLKDWQITELFEKKMSKTYLDLFLRLSRNIRLTGQSIK